MKKINKILKEFNNICSLPNFIIIVGLLISITIGLVEIYLANNSKISSSWWIVLICLLTVITSFGITVFVDYAKKIRLNIAKFDIFIAIMYIYSISMVFIFSPKIKRYYNALPKFRMAMMLVNCASFLYLLIHFIILLNNKNEEKDIYTLCDLYGNNIPKNKEDFYITDKATNNDLLDRTNYINEIKDAVFNKGSTGKRIIGITGRWGSGKTSLWQLAKKDISDKKYIIIEDFDCWEYLDDRSLFVGLIRKIYSKTVSTIINKKVKSQIEKLANIVMKDSPINSSIVDLLLPEDDNSQIVQTIENYLIDNNKSLIVVLDNLDRMDKESIVFTYKALATSLKFERTTYVCLYDEVIINSAFESSGFNYKYINKLLSYKIDIPPSESGKIKDLGFKCLNNYLIKYIEPKYYKYTFNEQDIKEYLSYIENPRDLVRFFNYIDRKLPEKCEINITDLVGISVIKTLNFELFDFIYNNFECFVTKRKYVSNYISGKITENQQSEIIQDLFSKNQNTGAFGKYYKFTNLVKKLFPPFEKVLKNENTQSPVKDASFLPISNGLFFEYYYSKSPEPRNTSFENDRTYKSLILKEKKTENDWYSIFKGKSNDMEKDVLFKEYIKFIAQNAKTDLMFKKLLELRIKTDETYYMELYGYILENLSGAEFLKRSEIIKQDIKNIYYYSDITTSQKTKTVIEQMVTSIIDGSIDLFNPSNYKEGTFRKLFMNNDSLRKKYISQMQFNSNNIFKLLKEYVTEGETFDSTKQNISTQKILNDFSEYGDCAKLRRLITQSNPSTSEEEDIKGCLKRCLNKYGYYSF